MRRRVKTVFGNDFVLAFYFGFPRRPPPAGRRAAGAAGGRPERGAALKLYLGTHIVFGVLFIVFASPCSLLRRFAAGTGGFLRLGAPRCGSRARPDATRRRVRLAGYYAAVIPAVNGRLRPMGAERRRRQATNGSDCRSSAREREPGAAPSPQGENNSLLFLPKRRQNLYFLTLF